MMYAAIIMSILGTVCGLLLWAGCAHNPNIPPLVKGLAIAGVLALAISNIALATARTPKPVSTPKRNTRKKERK
jgi:hypothetical protein